MRIKKPLNFGSWEFFVGEEDQTDATLLRIPLEGYYKSKRQAVQGVIGVFSSLSAQGKPEYKNVAEEEAKSMGITYEDYIGKVIEHQICLRSGGMRGGLCFPSGIGDKLHSFAEVVDNRFAKAPKVVKQAYGKTVSKILSVVNKEKDKVITRFSGCSRCGGSRSFSKQGKNLGRAGKMQ